MNNGQASVEPTDDVISPTLRTPNSSDPLNNGQVHVEQSIDESILNSEIYQIYCRAEYPHEAMGKIKEHNNCVLFEHEQQPFISEEEFKRISKKTLSNLWQQEAPLAESKFDRLKKFINGAIKNEVLGKWSSHERSMREVFQCMTKIQIVNPDGYEYFYVANFKLGHRRWAGQENRFSRWYRAVSSDSGKAQRLAQLKVLGITDSIMDQIQFKDTPTICKNGVKSMFLLFSDYFSSEKCKSDGFLANDRIASEL